MSNDYVIDERKTAMKRAVDLIADMAVNGAMPQELELTKKKMELMTAKTEALQSAKRVEELYGAAIMAMRRYSGAEMEIDDDEELERAILWSADVVRSIKEDVDWKQSYEDYVIAELEDKYQGADLSEYDKDYLVIDENYRSPHGDVGKGAMIAGFDTLEEAESLVKEMDSPGLVILGPKQK